MESIGVETMNDFTCLTSVAYAQYSSTYRASGVYLLSKEERSSMVQSLRYPERRRLVRDHKKGEQKTSLCGREVVVTMIDARIVQNRISRY